MYFLVDHPVPPFLTLAGDSKGPCVNVGVPTVNGAPIFIGEQETRSILKAFGWPAPETHAEIVAERDAAVEKAAASEAELLVARDQIAALELLLRIRQQAADPVEHPDPTPDPEPNPEPEPVVEAGRKRRFR